MRLLQLALVLLAGGNALYAARLVAAGTADRLSSLALVMGLAWLVGMAVLATLECLAWYAGR